MRKIITSIILTACVALCAAMCPRSAEVWDLPAEVVKTDVTAEIETKTEEGSPFVIPAENTALESEAIKETEPIKQVALTTTDSPEASQSVKSESKSAPSPAQPSAEPKSGSKTIIDGKPHVWIPGFGWIVDEGGGSVGITVGNPGDQLTGHNVGIMGGGTVGSNGDINKQVGIMGGGDAPANSDPAPGTKKYTDGVLHVWVPGLGYVPHSGDNVATYAEDMYESASKSGLWVTMNRRTERATLTPLNNRSRQATSYIPRFNRR